MSNLKIEPQYLPERCEICHQKDYFDPYSNYCSRCSQNNQITQQHANYASEMIAATLTDVCPKGIAISVGKDSCVLTYKWFNNHSLIAFAISVIIVVLTLFGKDEKCAKTMAPLQHEPLIFASMIMLMLSLLYVTTAKCINKTIIKITSSEIIVSQSPLPWLYNNRFSINEISGTYIDKKYDKAGYVWYRVKVCLANGKIYTLVPYIFNAEAAFFVSDQFYKWVKMIRVTTV